MIFEWGAQNPRFGYRPFGFGQRSGPGCRGESTSPQEPPVQRAVLDGLGEMGGAEPGGGLEVGEGSGHLQDAVEGADREAEALEGGVEQRLAGGVEAAVAAQLVRGHGGVAPGGGGRAAA